MIKKKLYTYIIAISIPLTVGVIAAALTRDSMNIYSSLKTPPLSPPSILFPIVWTILYILMGISSGIIYLNRNKNLEIAKSGLKYYGISLGLNFLWSIIFFRFMSAFFALICIIVLLYYIVNTIKEYAGISKIAAYIQIPYILWGAFATYLNAGILLLN